VTNVAFAADLVPYDGSYENSQLFSPKFRDFAERLSDQLRDRYALGGKHVVEVGCGKGEFLAMLCERGSLRGTGFDPTYDGEVEQAGAHSLRILRQPYDEHAAADAADLVCCRHVLEHIDRPVAFLRTIRRPMQPDTALYLEVPNAAFTFTASGLWDLIYQHCIYFTPDALAAAARAAGFEVSTVESVFDDQFLALEGRAGDAPDIERPVDAVGDAALTIERFAAEAARFATMIDDWRSRLGSWRADGRRVAMWGAGAKGVTFLNLTGIDAGIATVVDVNPRKHGRYLAGSGHRVERPDALRAFEPDVVLITNAAYREEIALALRELGVAPEVVSL
jgi:SAM-dependent methyltransferase